MTLRVTGSMVLVLLLGVVVVLPLLGWRQKQGKRAPSDGENP